MHGSEGGRQVRGPGAVSCSQDTQLAHIPLNDLLEDFEH
jgi:hypothetical protein